jgi:uncharacterized protein (TIGR02680 family)
MSTPTPHLPEPRLERWQPLRCGLLNVFRYDEEEFWFEQGRLLLRGNNGTGKSRVLALTLPFLLDGEVAPYRLEPDRDPAKRVEWNLLMGRHADRLGYTWVEMGRRDGDTARFMTLGCGLHAVEGRGLAGKWFFLTPQRIGRDLLLRTPAGAPLGRERLGEAVAAGGGRLIHTAESYRAAVDEALFGLGEQRYGALVDLLIQLRQPQLSRQLDEERLSEALSEALPPVSQAILADVAEAFRSLEEDRRLLRGFEEARKGVERFLEEYRRYARIAARRRADGVRARHAQCEATMRRLRTAEDERREAQERHGAEADRIAALSREERDAGAEAKALEEAPEMRNLRLLDEARQAAQESRAEAQRDDREAGEAARAAKARLAEAERAEARAAETRQAALAVARESGECAASCGLAPDHGAALEPAGLPDGAAAETLRAAERAIEAAVARRLTACRHMQGRVRAVEDAERDLTVAREEHARAASEHDDALEDQRAAHRVLSEASEALAVAFGGWAAGVAELSLLDPDGIVDALVAWCEAGEGKSPVETAVADALVASVASLASADAQVASLEREAASRLEVLRAERTRLEAGEHPLPAPMPARDPAAREGRPGAPLWRLCDFAAEVEPAARAGIEAALEGAGLLDAWVLPDGTLLDADDAFLTAASAEADGPPARHLGSALVPAVDRGDARAGAVPDETVAAVLCRIGLGEGAGSVWVAEDGQFGLGPAKGAHRKPAAEHIGDGARAQARRARLEALAGEIGRVEDELAKLRAEREELGRRGRAARAEAAAAPDHAPVRRAQTALAAAGRALDAARGRLAAAEARVGARRTAADGVAARRDADARDLGIGPEWLPDLRRLEDAVQSYRAAAALLLRRAEVHASSLDGARASREAASRAEEDAAQRAARARESGAQASAAAVRRETLEAAVGEKVEALLARLDAARRRGEEARAGRALAEGAAREAEIAAARSDERVSLESRTLETHSAERIEAVAALGRLAQARLLPLAADGLEEGGAAVWSVTRAVEIARRVEQALSGVDHGESAWERSEKQAHAHVQTLTDALLPHGWVPETAIHDGLLVVTVPYQGRSCTGEELCSALSDEVASRQTMLSAREREVLENHLVGEVSTHLHDLLRSGEAWVAKVNDELGSRPTSTGMLLRFRWEIAEAAPPGLAEARRRLLRAGGTWSPAEREALGAFLQEEIRRVRAERETGTWQEHLAQAFDYRRWHRFWVERQQDGQWKRLTRRTHGTGSGGEKAIALTLPQFAAAAAHYRSASPHAPRLILLDEAFVGVDPDMRSKCMGFLAAFDLDFAMTSEREWGCYPTIPGVSICQLSVRPGIDAVGVTRWVWNGRERVRAISPGEALTAEAPA